MTINDGNVGIGTTTPAARLDINSTYPEVVRVNSSQDYAGIEFTKNNNQRGMVGYGDLCGGGDANGLTI